MSERKKPLRQKIADRATRQPHEVIADAIRAAGQDIAAQLSESFGPRHEVRVVADGAAQALKSTLDAVRVRPFENPRERLEREIREAMDKGDLSAVVRADPEDLAKIRPYYETEADREQRLISEIRARVLLLSGYREEDQPTGGDVAQNELATERTGVVMDLLEAAIHHSYPEALGFPREDAPLHDLLNALRPLVYRIVNATADNDAVLTENVDVIMAFVNLAREHPDPKRLLPRGDRLGEWLPPGTRVTVGGLHNGTVEAQPDMVRVKLDAWPTPAGVFPRSVIAKEGEPWTPPKRTSS